MPAFSQLRRALIRSIRGRLVLVVAVVLLPAGLLASWLIERAYAHAQQAVERNLAESARALSLLTDGVLREHEARLDGLATSRQLTLGDLDAFRAQAQSLTTTSQHWFVLADADGRQLVNTSQQPGAALPVVNVPDELRANLRAGRTYYSNFTTGPATGRNVVYLVRAVVRENLPPRALIAVLTTDEISRSLLSHHIGDGRLIALIDREGRIIARNREPEAYVGQYASAAMLAATRQAPEGIRESVTLDGVPSLSAFSRSTLSGWTVILAAPRADLLAGSRTLVAVAAIVSLMCAAAGIVLAAWVGRAVVRAVQLLVAQTQALAHGPRKAPATGMDETDIIARALAEASQALAAREAELARARDEALAASRAKDDFLATLSHELRTPLNPVLLEASDAAADPRLSADVRERFEMIVKNVQLEARLIDDLLDLTRITRAKLSLQLETVDVHGVLRDALHTVHGVAQEKQLVVRTDWQAGGTLVHADPTRLQQVFWNLLNNAIKFTPAGGHVTVATSASADTIAIAITDTGIGLSPDELQRIFQAFVQGEHASPASGVRFGGLGLGLKISQLLVEKHGGSITADSRGRGHGATFTVRLPLLAPPDQAG